jgi:hypothetical protein
LLPDEASHVFAAQIVNSLVAREVPAVESDGRTGDWQLIATAELKGGRVVPTYTVKNPAGTAEGATQGPSVDPVAWAAGKPVALKQAAEAAAPPISDLLARIRAAQLQSDPNSLANRPPRVLVKEVVGAPGDGNASLTRQMREQLTQRGQVVQDTPEGADFTVEGKVRTAPAGNGMMQLDIRWFVTDAQRHDLGFAAQVNDVPAQMILGLWGDLAVVITQEASAGLRDIILKQPGVRHTEASAPGAPGAAKPKP